MLNGYTVVSKHIWRELGRRTASCPPRPSYRGALGKTSKYRQVTQCCSKSELRPQTIKDFFFFFGEMIKPGGGDRASCKKPHPEQASPRLTVNKYSLLAALPSTVRALAPIAFQVQTGKGEKRGRWQIGGLICFLLQFSLVGRFQFSRTASCLELLLDPTFSC